VPTSTAVRPRRIRTLLVAAGLASAVVAASVVPALGGSASSHPEKLSSAGGKAYFWAFRNSTGWELWRTDGTPRGTILYQEFQPGEAGGGGPSGDGGEVVLRGGRLYVYADDGVHGMEPFTIDPATGQRRLLRDIRKGIQGSDNGAAPDTLFLSINGRVIFPADNGSTGREWWVTEGTRASTKLLKEISSDSSWLPQWWAIVGGKLLFEVPTGPGGSKTWGTDGTTTGTAFVSDVSPGEQNYVPAPVLGGVALMRGFEPTLQGELYRSDGTSVTLVKDIDPGDGYGGPSRFIKLGDRVLFSADDGVHGQELWSTQGTDGTTQRITDINTAGDSTRSETLPVRIGTTVYFVADDGTGDELWRTDGTTATRVKNINKTGGSDPQQLTVAGGRVFFVANDGVNGHEPWVSDGTAKGTFMLRDINPTGDAEIEEFAPVAGGKVVFGARDATRGREPWVSDGTKTGTRLLKDIR
jgi:ELWxxDGT repeat protein